MPVLKTAALRPTSPLPFEISSLEPFGKRGLNSKTVLFMLNFLFLT